MHWAQTDFSKGLPMFRVVDFGRQGPQVTDCKEYGEAVDLYNIGFTHFGRIAGKPPEAWDPVGPALVGGVLIHVTSQGPCILNRWGRACTPAALVLQG